MDLINYETKSKRKDSGDMRFGHNKEKPVDIVGIIFNFLDQHPFSTLSEIFKDLKSLDFSYSKAAIGKILHKLEFEKVIKNTSKKNEHPKYSIIDTSEFKIQSDAYTFKDQICANSKTPEMRDSEITKIKPYKDLQKNIIVNTILKFGLISFYTCLASYRRSISPKHDEAKNKKLHELWLRNAMSFENNIDNIKFSEMLSKKIRYNITNKKLEEKMDEQSEIIDEDKMDYDTEDPTQQEIIDEAKKIEKIFSKMFPYWYDEFQSSEDVIDTMVNDLMREVCVEHPEYLLK